MLEPNAKFAVDHDMKTHNRFHPLYSPFPLPHPLFLSSSLFLFLLLKRPDWRSGGGAGSPAPGWWRSGGVAQRRWGGATAEIFSSDFFLLDAIFFYLEPFLFWM